MQFWSIDILRQSGWDLWTGLCVAASLVLISYAVASRIWGRRGRWLSLALIILGAGGTLAVLVVPAWHSPFVGLGWTLALMAILSATFYLNLVDQLGIARMTVLLAMRIAALALLVPMLFEPILRFTSTPKPQRPIAVLVDTSGSMSFSDVQNGPARIQSVWQTLGPLLPAIRGHFVPRFYTFSSGVQEIKKPEDLRTTVADGKSTDLVGAIDRVLADTPDDGHDPVVLMISDGTDNVSPNVVDAVRASKRKVYTISVGSPQAEPASIVNVAVESVVAPDEMAVGHEAKIVATIRSSDLANRVIDVKLAEIGDDGKPIGETSTQRLVLQPTPPAPPSGQTVELPYTPRAVGVRKIAVWVDPIAGERSLADNRQEIQALAVDPRIKLLYIEGRLRPEYTYANRLLGRDPNIEIASLLRLQKNKFAASGTVDGERFTDIPSTPQQWAKFDVILIGDLDASFLLPAQQQAIEQRVSDGGGLMMIGGQNNFGPGGYTGTPIEKALPVFAGPRDSQQEKSEFIPTLTAEGLAHPAMEGLGDWFPVAGGKPAKTVKPLRGNIVVGKAKSGAQILITHADRPAADGTPQIVLAVERYGKGRSAAFTADTTYLWSLADYAQGQDSPYNRFWAQMIRWLASEDVRSRQKGAGLEGLLSKTQLSFGELVKVRAMVRDEHGDATQYADVKAILKGPGVAKPIQTPLQKVEAHVGMYEATLPGRDDPGLKPGDYTIDLSATKDGKELGKTTLKFSVIPPADEMLKIAASPQIMEAIATETGGFHRPLAELPELLDSLIRADPAASVSQQRTVPLANTVRIALAAAGVDQPWPPRYDLPTQGLLVITLLAAEWLLRRRWQLA